MDLNFEDVRHLSCIRKKYLTDNILIILQSKVDYDWAQLKMFMINLTNKKYKLQQFYFNIFKSTVLDKCLVKFHSMFSDYDTYCSTPVFILKYTWHKMAF